METDDKTCDKFNFLLDYWPINMINSWKLKKKAISKPKKPWGRRIVGILMLILTLAFTAYDFPQLFWNPIMRTVSLNEMIIEKKPFRLGLDLLGGTHLIYEADMTEISDSERLSALDGVKNVIERRVNTFGVSEPVVQTITTNGTYRLVIELAGINDVSQAIEQIGKTPILEFKEPEPEAGRPLTDDEKKELETKQEQDRVAAKKILNRALAGENFDVLIKENAVELVEKATIANISAYSPYSDYFILVDSKKLRKGQIYNSLFETEEGINIVKVEDIGEIKEMQLSHILICYEGKARCENPIPEIEATSKIQNLKKEATPENFATLEGAEELGWATPDKYVAAFALAATALPVGEISDVVETEFGFHIIYKKDERPASTVSIKRILMPFTKETDIVPNEPWKNTALSGKQLKHAAIQFDQNTGVPSVLLEFNEEGADLFEKLTEKHVGESIAIFLDNNLISAPTVQQAISGGQAIITGDFTVDEAKLLAQDLNAGALPVPINLLSQQTVGPTLGAVSLAKSVNAGIVGLILVALFMVVFYRLSGFIATLALIFFAVINLAAYRFFDVTITLAGIAGFVLSIGIAVDANVLIFERLKEELRSGRDFGSAIDEAFSRAWTSIRDGNFTTLIAAAVLYWFSSSFIRGFALTLAIGVLLSMLSAITVSRVYLKNVLAWKWARKNWLFCVRRPPSQGGQ